MFKFKAFFSAVVVCSLIAAGALIAADGVGTSNGQVFRNDIPITTGIDHCVNSCFETPDPFVWALTDQRAQWDNDIVLELAAGEQGTIDLTPNGGGSIDVKITVPSDLTINGEVYEREQDLVLVGTVDSWPVGTNKYKLTERVNFVNGSDIVHLKKGLTLTLTVQ